METKSLRQSGRARLAAITAELDALVVSEETKDRFRDLIAEAKDVRATSGIGEYEELKSYLDSADTSTSPHAKIVGKYLRGILGSAEQYRALYRAG